MAKKKDILQTEVEEARQTITADGYPMSIGELTSMYRSGELIIRPEFQRLFRWKGLQKSRLVESILLGIPIPSVFVSQREDGKWELIDGLQRISTVLELQGELLDADGKKMPVLLLEETKYLPSLAGRSWDGELALPEPLRLDIKRSKIDIKILNRGSSEKTKFDLFQRLNNYGTPLSAQETRNALLVGASLDFFAWLQTLVAYEAFESTVLIPENDAEQRYDLELVLRFLVLHALPASELSGSKLKNFSVVLDDAALEMAEAHPKGSKKLERIFKTTFDHIDANGGSAIFSRWNVSKKIFQGSFLNTAFEVFALGIGYHVAAGTSYRSDLEKAAKEFWSRPDMSGGFATGKSTEYRLSRFIPIGRELLKA